MLSLRATRAFREPSPQYSLIFSPRLGSDTPGLCNLLEPDSEREGLEPAASVNLLDERRVELDLNGYNIRPVDGSEVHRVQVHRPSRLGTRVPTGGDALFGTPSTSLRSSAHRLSPP